MLAPPIKSEEEAFEADVLFECLISGIL